MYGHFVLKWPEVKFKLYMFAKFYNHLTKRNLEVGYMQDYDQIQYLSIAIVTALEIG